MAKIKTIGILTSGGDAPGMNAAIRAVTRSAIYNGFTVKGIYRGYDGLINDEIKTFTTENVSGIIGTGGTMLKTARSKEFMTAEGRQKAFENIQKEEIDALVVIGGNGSLTGAMNFASEFDVCCIGTSLFNWFDVYDLLSWLRLLVVLILPFFILWRSKEKKTEEESEKGKKFHQQLFGVLVFIGFLVSPGTLFSEDADNFWLCSFFYGAAICLCFVGEYLRGRYLLLYCNPSVSDETRKRSRVNLRKQLVQMVIVGALALIFLLVLSRFEPEMKMPSVLKTVPPILNE